MDHLKQTKKKRNKGWDNIKPIKKGEVRNPKGRPKGSRNKFSEKFIECYLKDFEEHGADAIVKVREKNPSDYLKIAASLVPKNFTIGEEVNSFDKFLEQLTDSELESVITGLYSVGKASKTGATEETTIQ